MCSPIIIILRWDSKIARDVLPAWIISCCWVKILFFRKKAIASNNCFHPDSLKIFLETFRKQDSGNLRILMVEIPKRKKTTCYPTLLAFFQTSVFLTCDIYRWIQSETNKSELSRLHCQSLSTSMNNPWNIIFVSFLGCFGIGDRNARLDIFLPRLRVQLYSSICRRHFAVTASKAGVSQTKIGFPKVKRVIIPT